MTDSSEKPAATAEDPAKEDPQAPTSEVEEKNSRFRISDEAAARMSPAELRAVGHDRGYKDIEGGRAGVLRKFLAAQKEDKELQDPPEGHHLAAPTPVETIAKKIGLSHTDGTPASPTPPVEAKKAESK